MTIRNAASMGTFNSTWQIAGYAGQGNVHELLGSLKGRVAIVVGSGKTVFKELTRLNESSYSKIKWIEQGNAVIFAVNDVGMFLPRVDHWVSLHGANLAAWKRVRWLHPHPDEFTKYHSVDAYQDIDYVWANLTPVFALSGYFAAQIAYIMGAERIILCGCPGDGTPRFYDLYSRKKEGMSFYDSDGVRQQLEHEMKRLPEFKAKVCSMSGWTREFFGGLE